MTDLAALNRAIADYYRQVGERVTRHRINKGIGQQDLATAVGLARSSIANLEAGRQRVPIHVLASIAAALGLAVADLLPDAPLPVDELPRVEKFITDDPVLWRMRELHGRLGKLLAHFDVEAESGEGGDAP